MVKFYVNRVQKNLMAVEDVPKLWKTKVEAELAKTEKE